MPLPIRDGNQSLTTLSTLIVNSAHVPAHTVVSLGSQAITDIAQAVSGVELGPNTLNALENITVTLGQVTITGGLTDAQLRASAVTIGGSVQVSNFPATQSVTFSNPTITGSVSVLNLPSTQTIAGTVTANVGLLADTSGNGSAVFPVSGADVNTIRTVIYSASINTFGDDAGAPVDSSNPLPISGTVTANDSGALSIVNSSTVTKADVKFTAIAGAYNASEFASTYSLRPLSTNSGGTLLIDGNVAGSSILSYDGWAYVRVAQSPGSVVTVGSLPAISGTVTIGASSVTFNAYVGQRGDGTWSPISLQTGSNYVNANVLNSVTIGSLPAISGTVTANTAYATSITGFAGGAGSVTALPVVISDRGIYGGNFLGYNGSNTFLNVGIASVGNTSLSTRTDLPVSGTITVGNSVTIGSLPNISGTVTARLQDASGNNLTSTTIGGSARLNVTLASATTTGVALPSVINVYGGSDSGTVRAVAVDSSGRSVVTVSNFPATQPVSIASVTIGNSITIGSFSTSVTARLINPAGTAVTYAEVGTAGNPSIDVLSVQGITGGTAVPISISSVTIGSIPAISGTVTLGAGTSQVGSVTVSAISTSVTARLVDISGTAVSYASTGTAGTPSSDVISVQGVSGGTSLPISGTAGSLTTRFGSVTTAGTAQISSAVTNASRKYLLIQNVTTSSNVITVGIGFTPTTTQGIQLSAGAGITFESSYIPTGAVYILSGVTASPFTILEA